MVQHRSTVWASILTPPIHFNYENACRINLMCCITCFTFVVSCVMGIKLCNSEAWTQGILALMTLQENMLIYQCWPQLNISDTIFQRLHLQASWALENVSKMFANLFQPDRIKTARFERSMSRTLLQRQFVTVAKHGNRKARARATLELSVLLGQAVNILH
jgi:hypothetical protein